jgi:hypothetical protein
VLQGFVTIQYGNGLAKIIGQRLAIKLGIPKIAGEVDFKVEIKHSKDTLFWNRIFCDNLKMNSTFKPYGSYPNGYWQETTGMLSLELGVEIIDGGWHWVQKKVRFYGLPLPLWLLPKTHAYKKIVNGQYFFSVSFSLPIIGKLVSYSGSLEATPFF